MSLRSVSPCPFHEISAFEAWRGSPADMSGAHMHNVIEMNFVLRGSMRYFLAGRFETIRAGRLSVFWAGMPHQLIAHAHPTECIWVMVPLAWFMQWGIVGPPRQWLLEGKLLQEPDQRRSVAERDRGLLERWCTDLRTGTSADLRGIVELEVRARLWRLFLSATPSRRQRRFAKALPPVASGQIDRVTRYINEHYAESKSVTEIARAVQLPPNYLMQQFKRNTGMSLWNYVIHLRISHAQRLLLTTDLKIVDIAMESGFNSVNRFHDSFQRLCHCTPRKYRVTAHSNS